VRVHRGEASYYVAPAAAEHLLHAGLATVRQKHQKVIANIELTREAIGWQSGQIAADQLGLRPGSFGIRVEHFPSGTQCYAHNDHVEVVKPR